MKFSTLSLFLFCCFLISRSLADIQKLCEYDFYDPGFCGQGLLKWVYESKSNACIEVPYGGCEPNSEYETEEECKQNCIK